MKTDIDRSSLFMKTNPNNYSELKWQFALENSHIGIWDFNADFNRVFYSKESKNIIGFNDGEFGTNPNDWNNRVHPEDKEKYFQDFKNHIDGITPIYENEHRILCKDGTYKWILDKGKVIERDYSGKPKRIIGTHTDITTRKESEVALANSIGLISEQNKKLNSFAHIVTHNLKSHSGNIESLLTFYDEATNEIEREEFIEHLKTVATSLSKTISNLNHIVSIQSNKSNIIESLNIFNYINNAISLLEVVSIENNATIKNRVSKDLSIYANPAYLESIFQNLLSNAIKYRHPDRDPLIEINSEITDELIVLTIEDNGLGIDLNKYGKDIFNLYRTFHKNENSEGVGLYLIKNHIESYGGTIEVDSKVNIGSIFTIKIPNKKNPV